MANFTERLAKINNDYMSLTKQYNTGSCWKLSMTMSEFEGALREHIQKITEREIRQIIFWNILKNFRFTGFHFSYYPIRF